MTDRLRALDRARDGRPAAPVRIVHLGLGNFFRAHAASYTDRAPDAGEWGVAAFTGRSPQAAEALAAQDGLYTLLVKGPDGPRAEVVSSISTVHAAKDLTALRGHLARPEVAVVTLTVTEAAYPRTADGGLDGEAPGVAADMAVLAADLRGGAVSTVPGRLVTALAARRDTGAGPLAVVSNDNIPDNGAVLGRIVGDLAEEVDPALARWIDVHVSFVTTMVDRITPATTDEDRAVVADMMGVDDHQVVPTEPFSDWVLAGHFPAGRPRWDLVGARFVDDVRPFEQMKLWMLNGAHSLMAYAAPVLGHDTVASAVGDPRVRGWVQEWWDAAAPHLAVPEDEVRGYRSALLDRFANPGIRHMLAQIAADGSQKIPVRAVPVLRAGLATGTVEPGAVRLLATWIAHLRGSGAPVSDAAQAEVEALATGSLPEAVERTLAWLDLPADPLREPLRRELDALLALADRADA